MPRRTSHAESGERVAPSSSALVRTSDMSDSGPAATPASTSECPFRYLVAECMTMSAPHSSGRQFTGVATVLSTRTRAPAACATSQIAGRSATARFGFESVSTTTSAAPETTRRSPSMSPTSKCAPSGRRPTSRCVCP